MLTRVRSADLISIYSPKSFSGFTDMSPLSSWFWVWLFFWFFWVINFGELWFLYEIAWWGVSMMFCYCWAVSLWAFRALVVIFESASVGLAQFWPAPHGSTGQLFLILVLLITLAFRSSDYITIFFRSQWTIFYLNPYDIITVLKQQPQSMRKQVEEVSVDMWGGFPKVIKSVFPNAKVVIDRFHVLG